MRSTFRAKRLIFILIILTLIGLIAIGIAQNRFPRFQRSSSMAPRVSTTMTEGISVADILPKQEATSSFVNDKKKDSAGDKKRSGEEQQKNEDVSDETNATVVHVVDGDTLDAKIDGMGTFRIRLLGADTPEVVDPRKPVQCYGEIASAFSKKTLAIGSRIRLVPDPQADERDMYGRLLRNVYLADGTDYNAYLVEQGYARAYTYFPLTPSRKVQMIQLQSEAKEAGRGLWVACK